MPAPLSRKRYFDAVQVTPEKRRRVSAGLAHDSPQEPFRIEVHRERDEVVGPCDWHKTWAKRINCSVHVQFGQGRFVHNVQIGKCHSLFIERDRIRHNFQAHMAHRSSNTAFLASVLFDEIGCLKPELTNGALTSGSGLWSHELSDGDIFIIESIEVPRDYSNGNIAPVLVERMLQEASRLCRKPFFAFTLGSRIGEIDSNQCKEDVKKSESFWRANGFRRVGMTPWFAWCSEPNHPARRCSSSADFDLAAQQFFSKQNHNSLLHTDILKGMPDEDCVEIFREAENDISLDDLRRIDAGGNTLFHLAAVSSKPQLLSWFMVHCPPEVRGWRNFDRQTPLEILFSARAEKRRALEEAPQDAFEGHDDASVDCQLRLGGFLSVTEEIYQRMKFDCSCMRCFGGFLSPRTQVKLIAAARNYLETNYEDHLEREKLVKWLFLDSEDLSDTVKRDLQELVLICMQHVAITLTTGDIPTAELVFRRLMADPSFSRSQVMVSFILDNGVVESAITAAIESASSLNDLADSGGVALGYIIQDTPSCHNDNSWALVRDRLASTNGNHRMQ